jgi:hypothetical protein
MEREVASVHLFDHFYTIANSKPTYTPNKVLMIVSKMLMCQFN